MSAPIRRARPLLGTIVEIRVEAMAAAHPTQAIDRAFAEIASVHRLMSFHEPGSDLGRLHTAPIGQPVAVDARTLDVLATALRIAAASAGAFDPAVAAQQVARGALPRPASAWSAESAASWRDIDVCGARCVRLARPLWIDLGGIAKGYAVDRAIEILLDAGAKQACVNAGGDLRVAGAHAETVHLRGLGGVLAAPIVEVRNGALASSATDGLQSRAARTRPEPIDGRRRRSFDAARIVAVAADCCMVADALTKVVLGSTADEARGVLEVFGAQATEFAPPRRRVVLGAAA